jgi:hypothetical protein
MVGRLADGGLSRICRLLSSKRMGVVGVAAGWVVPLLF